MHFFESYFRAIRPLFNLNHNLNLIEIVIVILIGIPSQNIHGTTYVSAARHVNTAGLAAIARCK